MTEGAKVPDQGVVLDAPGAAPLGGRPTGARCVSHGRGLPLRGVRLASEETPVGRWVRLEWSPRQVLRRLRGLSKWEDTEVVAMASVHDVAAYVLTKTSSMSTMKLQKLCYYSQAWSLVWDEEPLFESPIQAWANGPVIYDLFREHRGSFQVSSWGSGNAEALDAAERETVDAVWDAYGDLSGQQLSDLTHSERPWLEARDGLPLGARSSAVISLDSMQDFYAGVSSDVE
jgi:uncharacterized phage-associated protein